uniref:Uncharacterized protein n=1 Tax=Rhipicephalus microplus TaxID=6941 RepID=A0A6G5AF54_RHIMP
MLRETGAHAKKRTCAGVHTHWSCQDSMLLKLSVFAHFKYLSGSSYAAHLYRSIVSAQPALLRSGSKFSRLNPHCITAKSLSIAVGDLPTRLKKVANIVSTSKLLQHDLTTVCFCNVFWKAHSNCF